MNVLILGNGKGSWAMRGEQIGARLDARVRALLGGPLRASDLAWADVAILIKRSAVTVAPQLHDAEIPIVWDALDFWIQPSDNALSEPDALDRLRRLRDQIRPALSVGATWAMTRDLVRLGEPATYLPHHSWDGLAPTPAREAVTCVAYQGNPVYLGRWQATIARECQRRRWNFFINPADLSVADLVVAFRDAAWDGWMCQTWKSGVKVVNAIAAGRPLITQRSAAVDEIGGYGSVIDRFDALSAAFDQWEDRQARQDLAEVCAAVAPAYRLDAIVARYRPVLERVATERCVHG